MKLSDIFENYIVPKDKLKPKTYWTVPKMKKTQPPFSKGAFKKLLKKIDNKQLKDPAGGKVLRKSNIMNKGEIG